MAMACNEKRTGGCDKGAYETPVKGKRSRGRQKLRWRDVVQRDMKQKRIDDGIWTDRNQWSTVCKAADPV